MREPRLSVSRRLAIPLLSAALVLQPVQTQAAAKVSDIRFRTAEGRTWIDILSDAPVTYEKSENSRDRQVVIELKGARLGPNAIRIFDTSSFNSAVKLISPYQVGKTDTARIVIQLREAVPAEVTQNGNVIQINLPNGSTIRTSSSAADDAPGLSDTGTQADAAGLDNLLESGGAPPSAPVGDTQPAASVPQPDTSGALSSSGVPAEDNRSFGEKQIDTVIESAKTKKFIGKPIDVNVQDVDILQVLQMIGEASGFNVIVGEDVRGKVTLSLSQAPWDQVLDLILTNFQLGAERSNNVLRILTLAKLTTEKQLQLQAKRAAEESAPRITRVFPISYARLSDLSAVFAKFASASGDGKGTVVQQDDRTNSIIARDTAENLDRIKRLIEILDTQTPQVLIEAKVVETSESGSNTLGGNFGMGRAGTDQFYFSANGGNPIDPLLTATSGSTVAGATSQSKGAGIGLSPSFQGIIPGISRLNATLAIAENESKARVLSSPRVVVLNKEQANIISGQPVLVKGTSVQNGIVVPTDNVQAANLSLNVTPTVTNDAGVLMEVSVSRDTPVPPGIANRSMKTKVVVDSGSTLVIGGIYTTSSTEQHQGVPVLKDIPILGVLFGEKNRSDVRFELFIFITPRILNEKEAGLTG